MLKKPHYYVMRILMAQVVQFLKVVQATELEKQKKFKDTMLRLRSFLDGIGYHRVNEFIIEYKDLLSSENEFNKITDAFYRNNLFNDEDLGMTEVSLWIKSLQNIDPKFKQWATDYLLKMACDGIMEMENVLQLEAGDVFGPQEMRSILIGVIQRIQQNGATEYIVDLSELNNSKHLSPKLLERLLRTYAPLFYTGTYFNNRFEFKGNSGTHDEFLDEAGKFHDQWSQKQEYNSDDVVYFMESIQHKAIPYHEFRHVLDHARKPAQEIMRRGLYSIQKRSGNDFNMGNVQVFILDETLQPIDADYRPVHIDSNALMGRITSDNQMALGDEQTKTKWGQLFADLGMIAYPGTW